MIVSKVKIKWSDDTESEPDITAVKYPDQNTVIVYFSPQIIQSGDSITLEFGDDEREPSE